MTREEFIQHYEGYPEHMMVPLPCACNYHNCLGWQMTSNEPPLLCAYYDLDAPAFVKERAKSWRDNYPAGKGHCFKYGGHFL